MPETLVSSNHVAPDATYLPYGRHCVDEDDIAAVSAVLRSGWLTTGPAVESFENAFASFVNAKHAVAVNSGTAALHAAMHVAGVGVGDEVVVPSMTFAATAGAVVYSGATPVFVDINGADLLIDPKHIDRAITEKTRAIVSVDYAGQPCDYDALRAIASRHGLTLIADACHSLGAKENGRLVGSLADLNCFSFHPVKQMTTGEGGMITTDDPAMAEKMRRFRNHGISADHHQRTDSASWFYEITDLGYNYRLTDIQCALGLSQLKKIPKWLARRRSIAELYASELVALPGVSPLSVRPDVDHAYHLYVVELDLDRLSVGRREVFEAMRKAGIGVNVHYIPVHLHPLYRERFSTVPGDLPVTQRSYERILSLPMFPTMCDADVQRVVDALRKACKT